MRTEPSPLPEEIAALLSARRDALGGFAEVPRYYACVTSTNDVMARLAEAGAPEGAWVMADEQTAGRGRRGHSWASPPGSGLYLSVLFRPDASRAADRAALPLLTLMAGVAVANGIRRATGLGVTVKWPNDVVVEPAGVRQGHSRFRKLAGILAEASATGDAPQYVVLGVGINVSPGAYPPDVEARATSVEGELGRQADRALLLVELLAALADGWQGLRDGHASGMLRDWSLLAPSSEGRLVRWRAGEEPNDGITQGIDASGALYVKTRTGFERIIAGELEWE